ncbi:MAG: anaerobic ribonucleoside-triphosphate reductase [Bacillota bacterium]
MYQVLKRDGRLAAFEADKIVIAIHNAVEALGGEDMPLARDLTAQVLRRLRAEYRGVPLDIERIQEEVETVIIENGLAEIAKAYIRYRASRSAIRDGKSELMEAVAEITRETSRDNANVGHSPAAKVLQIMEATSARYYLDRIIPKKEADAHIAGDFYIHDLPWFGKTLNCIQIPLGKMLEKGFSNRHGYCRPPKGIGVAAEHAAIIMQANQNDMHGGQGYAYFDRDLASFVIKERERVARELRETIERLAPSAMDDWNENSFARLVEERLERKVFQSMEGFVYNMCFMHSRAGAQVVFSSVNFGTDTTPEGRMITRNLLLAYEKGLGKGEQPLFPNLIFKVKGGVNRNPGDPNYDLFHLAIQVAARRLFPSFANEDASFNGGYREDVVYMGCRTRVMANVNGQSSPVGRGNLFACTLNLPRYAIEAKGSIEAFFARLNQALDLAVGHLINRYDVLRQLKVKDFPFLMQEGLYRDSETLGPEDSIEPAIKHGTLSIGFIGLAEALVALTGEHHGQSERAQGLGRRIVVHIRKRTDAETQERGLNFSTLATPAEGLSGKFTAKDKEIYGTIPGLTDKEWYTNSFHVPVEFQISAFDKITIESPYHRYCNGGHISYVELESPPVYNVEAYEALVKAMLDADMGYFSINYPLDICKDCGYTGVIKSDSCPKCDSGNVSRIRRITGYLSEITAFNAAKRSELDRRLAISG